MSKDDFLLDVASTNGRPQRLVVLYHTTAGEYRDTFNPDSARSREKFIKDAAKNFDVEADSLDWLRADLPRLADEADATLDEQLGDDDRGERDKKSTADLLVELALEQYRIGRTETDEAFAVQKDGPNVALMFRGSRDALRSALAREHRQQHGRTPNSSALADALTVLQGEAYEAEPEAVHLRIAEHNNKIIVDLGDATGCSVVIGPGGWQVVDRSPVLFCRTAATGSLPVPQEGGSLAELRVLLNVTAETWPLALGWEVAAFMPNMPHPILMLGGQQGTGKTTAAKKLVGVVDPSPAVVRSHPRDVETWAITTAGSWVVAIDNVSIIPAWWSDALCKAVTGDGWLRRKLYTDGELAVLSFRRVILLTSIDPGALKGDLGDRVLLVDLEPIDERKRRAECDIDSEYEAARPRIFGALLDLLAKVLAELPNVHLDRMPRMADFGRLLAAMDNVLEDNADDADKRSLDIYLGQRERIAETVIESDQVALAILALLDEVSEWEGTASELLEKITPERPPKGWPGTPQSLGGRLSRLMPALEQAGIVVTRDREGHSRTRKYHLERQRKHLSALSASSAPQENPEENGPNAADNLADNADAADNLADNCGPVADSACPQKQPEKPEKNGPADNADDADNLLQPISDWGEV